MTRIINLAVLKDATDLIARNVVLSGISTVDSHFINKNIGGKSVSASINRGTSAVHDHC